MRAAINTPIQGSAADVATAAMLSIAACEELRELGWIMLLQVPHFPTFPLCIYHVLPPAVETRWAPGRCWHAARG
jgi:hypothetical protein